MGEIWFKEWEDLDDPMEEWTDEEQRRQMESLACRYMTRRGMEVIAQDVETPSGKVAVIARDEDGELVLADVDGECRPDGDVNDLPELAVDAKRKKAMMRRLLACLSKGDGGEDHVRYDVVAMNVCPKRQAKLRHLVGVIVLEG